MKVPAFLILCIVLAAGFGARAARYVPSPSDLTLEAEASVRERLEAHGWREGSSVAFTDDGAYRALAFHRTGCQGSLLVSVMGAGIDGAAIYERSGRAWKFVHAGRIGDAPQSREFLAAAVKGFFTSRRPAPVLAISSPPSDEVWCPAHKWETLTR